MSCFVIWRVSLRALVPRHELVHVGYWIWRWDITDLHGALGRCVLVPWWRWCSPTRAGLVSLRDDMTCVEEAFVRNSTHVRIIRYILAHGPCTYFLY